MGFSFFSVFVQYFFILMIMKIFVQDFSTSVQARINILGLQVDDDLLYCGILRTSLQLLILLRFCPIFLFSSFGIMNFFVKDFSTTLHARMFIFHIWVDDDF